MTYTVCLDCACPVYTTSAKYHENHRLVSKELDRTPITAGSQVSDVTGKSVATLIIENGVPEEHRAEVFLFANRITHTSPGYRYSDGAREAVRIYQTRGIANIRDVG